MIVVLTVGLVFIQLVLIPRWKRARELDTRNREAYNAEAERIEALPKLNRLWLMSVPENLMDKNPIKRSFGKQYNRILIVDENGHGWVGLVTPDIIESLTAGEYLRVEYYVPFRGAGEEIAGEAVMIGDVEIDIYPLWLSPGINHADWGLWAIIEKNFRDRSKNWNYHSGIGQLNLHLKEFRNKREEFDRLAKSAKMQD